MDSIPAYAKNRRISRFSQALAEVSPGPGHGILAPPFHTVTNEPRRSGARRAVEYFLLLSPVSCPRSAEKLLFQKVLATLAALAALLA
jgi:hypothetical protein